MRTQLCGLMVVDVVGYSALMEEDARGTVQALSVLRDETLTPAMTQHHGELLKSLGDGWIVSFQGVSAPVDCAMQILRGLTGAAHLRLRIGCHLGELIRDEHDFYGSGVNIAARAQTEAPPGGLMVSEDLYRQLPAARARELSDAGTFRLRNIAQPVRLYSWRPARTGFAATDKATTIAVSAFDFAPADEDTRAIAADLRDELLTRMSRRSGVVVLDGQTQSAEATYDLRGRLRVAGGRGRLSLTLVLRTEGRPVWSESYDGATGDIFAFCDGVLEQAEGDLRLQTNAFDGDRLAHLPDESLSLSELRARAANQFYKPTVEA